MLESRKHEWKKDVHDAASDRFERRLSEELGSFRVEVAREFSLVRLDMASMRASLLGMRVSLLRWMFAFWIGQFAVTLTVVAMILHAAKLL